MASGKLARIRSVCFDIPNSAIPVCSKSLDLRSLVVRSWRRQACPPKLKRRQAHSAFGNLFAVPVRRSPARRDVGGCFFAGTDTDTVLMHRLGQSAKLCKRVLHNLPGATTSLCSKGWVIRKRAFMGGKYQKCASLQTRFTNHRHATRN
jgi:hypothetical protein